MRPAELAAGRARTWGLLGRLLTRPMTGAERPWVEAVPALAEGAAGVDADALAARHHDALEEAVYPYVSAFRSRDGQLGGEHAAAVRHTYDQIGFGGVGEPDHLGLLAACLSWLCQAEAEAPDASSVQVARQAQEVVLRDHVLPVVGVMAVALDRHGDPFYATVAALTAELAASHEVRSEPVWPEPIDVLEAPKAGLATVARALLVPSRTGWLLSRKRIAALGRAVDVPAGFGRRWQMLESLLAGAAGADRLDALADAADAELDAWDAAYAHWGALGLPVAGPRRALAATRGVTRRLAEAQG